MATMASWFNYRRRLLLLLLIGVAVLAISARISDMSFWIGWSTIAIFIFMVLLIDIMFFDSSSFIYEPNYAAWQAKSSL